jgi:hypothetical protein
VRSLHDGVAHTGAGDRTLVVVEREEVVALFRSLPRRGDLALRDRTLLLFVGGGLKTVGNGQVENRMRLSDALRDG